MIDLNPIYRFFFQLSRAARSHHIDPLLVIERGVKRLPEWKAETGGLEAREAYSKRLKRHLKQRFTCRSFSRSFVFFFGAADRKLFLADFVRNAELFFERF